MRMGGVADPAPTPVGGIATRRGASHCPAITGDGRRETSKRSAAEMAARDASRHGAVTTVRLSGRGAARWTRIHVSVACQDGCSKMLRASDRTHEGFRRQAQRGGVTIDQVTAAALRALRQKQMGEQLATPLEDDEAEWLDATLR